MSNEDLISLVRTGGLRDTQTRREFSEARPLLNAGLGGMVRLSAVMSVTRDVHVSARFHRLTAITLPDLTGPPWLTLSPALAHFLQACVRAHVNILVTGGVDAGKTTLLRALCSAVDPDERIATLESDRELFLDLLPGQHLDVVPFEARQANSEGVGAIDLHDLIPQALRMNPRRIIVGEVRDQEIRPMLEAMNSGQEGSMATLHANSMRRGLQPDPHARPARPDGDERRRDPPGHRPVPADRGAHPQGPRRRLPVRVRGHRGAAAGGRRPAQPQPDLRPRPRRPRRPRALPQPRDAAVAQRRRPHPRGADRRLR